MNGLEIHRMLPEEAGLVYCLEEECFPDPWSVNSLAEMLNEPHSLYLAAVLDGKMVGYCGTRLILDEGEILRIATETQYRGRGIGSALMDALLKETPQITSWYLEVREHNDSAIALYRKFGFQTIGKRKKYYHHPEEDAVLMQRQP